jgi:hypothetical protein
MIAFLIKMSVVFSAEKHEEKGTLLSKKSEQRVSGFERKKACKKNEGFL